MNIKLFSGMSHLIHREVFVYMLVISLALLCRNAAAQQPKNAFQLPSRLPAGIEGKNSGPLWEEQMHDAYVSLSQKNYTGAEQSCVEALQTSSYFGRDDSRVATNLVFLAGVYQLENKLDLAEHTLMAAITNREAAAGGDGPESVMPLEKLANFYYFVQRRYDLAAPLCLRIFKIVDNTSPPDTSEVVKRALAVAAVYRIQGQYPEAEPFYQRTLAAATNDDELPQLLLTAAGFYHDWGKDDLSEGLCQRALAIRQKETVSNPGPEAEMNLAISLYGLAEAYRGWGKPNQAEPFYDQSLAITERINGASSSELARPLAGLACTLATEGKTNQALALYQRAFAVTETNLEPGSPVVDDVISAYAALLDAMHRSGEANALRQSYQWRGLIHGSSRDQRLNNLPEAERLAIAALDLAGTFDSADTRFSKSEVQLAEVYRQEGKFDLAERTYKDAIASCKKAVGPKSPELVFPLQSLANFYYYSRVRYDQVAILYRTILDIIQANPSPSPHELARWQRNLAGVYRLLNLNTLAENFYRSALASVESATNAPIGESVEYLQSLGDFYRVEGKYNQAEAVLNRALAIRQRELASNSEVNAELDVAVCCDYLGQNYCAWNRPEQAEHFYRRSLELVEQVSGNDSTDLGPRLIGLASALRAQKKYAEAKEQYERDLEITEKGIGPNTTEVAEVLDQYAGLLTDMNKTDDAKAMRDWAGSLRRDIAAQPN
jgi:tetratricopeptide (TPR) repeat protein